MVSRIASKTRAKITSRRDPWTIDFGPGELLEGLTVRWGRDSLRSGPRNRTATLSIQAPQGRSPGELFWASLEIWIRGETVFSGTIDAIETKDKEGRLIWQIAAVEAPTMLRHLTRNVVVERCERPGDIWRRVQNDGRNPKEIEIIGLPFGDDAPILASESVTSRLMQFSFWDTWSALASLWPGSFPIWRPGFKKVGTSVWRFDSYPRINIPSRSVVFSPARYSLSEMILAIEITSGGLYGDRDPGDTASIDRNVSEEIRLNGARIKPWNVDKNWDFPVVSFNQPIAITEWEPHLPWQQRSYPQRAAAFLLCQPTAPLTMTVHDRYDMPEVPAAVWRTWEEQSVFSITGTRKPPPGVESSWLSDRVAIGGTIRVSRHESTHEIITVQGRDARF